MSLKRNLDKNKMIDYIKEFTDKYKLSDDELFGLCKLMKENGSINGKYRTILKVQIKNIEKLLKEVNNGESTSED